MPEHPVSQNLCSQLADRPPSACSYAPGTHKAAKALLALREGWEGLERFPVQDRAALVFSAGMLLPYSAPQETPDFQAGGLQHCKQSWVASLTPKFA